MLDQFFDARKAYKKLKRKIESARLASMIKNEGIDLFLDVGANKGQTAIALRRGGYNGGIISFEPVKHCHDALLAASKPDPHWDIFERSAIGETSGETEILVSAASDLSSIQPPTAQMLKALPKAAAVQKERVPIRRLDDIMANRVAGAKAPFLKVDAQGHDLAVIRGALGIMDHLHGIQVELSLLPLYDGEPTYLDALQLLHDNGFSPRLLVERAYSDKLGRQLQIDGVFFRDC